MDIDIGINEEIVVDDLCSTPGGIVLQIAITSVGVALGSFLIWAAPKAYRAVRELVTAAVQNDQNKDKGRCTEDGRNH